MSSRRQRRYERRYKRLTGAAEKLVERFGPKVTATGAVGDLNFEADGPVCTGAQKAYVHQAVEVAVARGVLAEEPELTEELTIGQAERILGALGVSPDELYQRARAFGAGREQKAWRAGR